mmetsp:Transcript_76963/g.166505  ORF Transcript_76963/g.166505 Transcript_76963/m.166505 type:complete len:159 (+) Transcript_76963:693-1169(+)
MDLEKQIKALTTTKVECVVACPGRLLDLLKRGHLVLSDVQYLVLDEADRMMEMGFEIQLKEIFDNFGLNLDKIQFVMASATFPSKVIHIAQRYIANPVTIRLPKEENATNRNITQVIQVVNDNDKFTEVSNLLNGYDLRENKVIIFCNRKQTCNNLES